MRYNVSSASSHHLNPGLSSRTILIECTTFMCTCWSRKAADERIQGAMLILRASVIESSLVRQSARRAPALTSREHHMFDFWKEKVVGWKR